MTKLEISCVGTIGSVMRDVLPAFERETGIDVAISFANPAATAERVGRGVPVDLAIVANGVWDAFATLPRVDPTNRVALCRTAFRAGVGPGTTPADVSTMAALRRLLVATRTLALVDRSASTLQLHAGFETLGIATDLAAKTRLFPTGEAVAEALARGDVDLGITTTSELVSVADIVLLGPLPREIAPADTISIASVVRDATNPDGARRLVDYLMRADNQRIFAAKGHNRI